MRKSKRQADAYSVSTVERALNVIEAFTPSQPELSLTEITRLTGLPTPTTFRLLTTLTRRGVVNRSPATGQYRLGYRLIALAEIAKSTIGLLNKARPVMRKVRDALQETTYLSVRSGDYRIDLEQAEGLREVRRVIKVGHPTSLHIGCPGKVLLAAMSDHELRDYLTKKPLGNDRYGTPIDSKQLERDIKRARKNGYAETRNRQGAGAISAPIYGSSGDTLGALTVSVPFGRYTEDLRTQMLSVVLDAARFISAEMGCQNSRTDSRRP